MIEKFGHGSDIWTAEEIFGVPRNQLHDFSANINPLGPPESVRKAIQGALPSVLRYPDIQSRQIKQVISNHLNIETDQLIIGNGATEVLYGVLRAIQPRRVGLLQPCFSEYAAAADVVGAKLISVFAHEEDDFLPQLQQLIDVCEQVDIFIAGHPNNPNGRLLPIEWLKKMADVLLRKSAYLLIDEAFIDFLPRAISLVNELPKLHNVIFMRSMTKFYSIPGLRLGYGIASSYLAAKIAYQLPPWRVNCLAEEAGIAGILDQEFVRQTWNWLQVERPFFANELNSLPGFHAYSGEANFILFKCKLADLQMKLGRKHILIRSCASYPGLGVDFYRVAVRTRDENMMLIQCLQQLIEGES